SNGAKLNLQGLTMQFLCLLEAALIVEGVGQSRHGADRVRVLNAEDAPLGCERLSIQALGLGVATLLLYSVCQIVYRRQSLRMFGSKYALFYLQWLPVDSF